MKFSQTYRTLLKFLALFLLPIHFTQRHLKRLFTYLLNKETDHNHVLTSLLRDFPLLSLLCLCLPLVTAGVTWIKITPPILENVMMFSTIIEIDPEKKFQEDSHSSLFPTVFSRDQIPKSDRTETKGLWIHHWQAKTTSPDQKAGTTSKWLHDYSIDHFYCRGEPSNTFRAVQDPRNPSETLHLIDCFGGRIGHGLPFIQGKPWFSSTLVQYCNRLQDAGIYFTVLQGHCCPLHADYLDPEHARTDRHIMGAATTIEIETRITKNALIDKLSNATNKSIPLQALEENIKKGFQFAYNSQDLRFDLVQVNSRWIVRIETRREQDKSLPFHWKAYEEYLRY